MSGGQVFVYNQKCLERVKSSGEEEDIARENLFTATLVSTDDKSRTASVIDDELEKLVEAVPVDHLFLRNAQSAEDADDITTLTFLHEPALLHNLLVRYRKNIIYTFTGPILIAVNPFQMLPGAIYGPDVIDAYRGQQLGHLSPHVYAIAEDAFRMMLLNGTNQSILVSGESGAGKTETTKFLLSYFAAMTKLAAEEETAQVSRISVEQQVLSSTPLLESFGNAKTLRNDNSSRFGKFIEIQFDDKGSIIGAVIRTYLLEKSRLVYQATGERNYHIFYQLIAGLSESEKKLLSLTRAQDFQYLNKGQCVEIEGVSDSDVFHVTCKAMKTIGLADEEITQVYTLLASVLHIGNISFVWSESSNKCNIENSESLQIVCDLLGVKADDVTNSMISRTITVGRENYIVNLSKQQAEAARDSLAMLLYSRLFDYLVQRINDNIASKIFKHVIGILDIYGFESFKTNSFEQFCINYANEKLQQQYNHHVFKLSQQEYIKEKIEWSSIEFNDNQECLDLIEKGNLSILSLLDEECKFPKANEKTFAEKLLKNHEKHKYFEKPRFLNTGFTICHYADKVIYDTGSFLEKNKDFIVQEQLMFLVQSTNSFVQLLFATEKQGIKNKGAAFQFSSVSSQFKNSLNQLMAMINSTYPHYIRCIKPNMEKKPNMFNKKLILQQLKCGGILESVRICLQGYPTKKTFEEFAARYKLLITNSIVQLDLKKLCSSVLEHAGIPKEKYQLGLTKIFMRAGQIELLEHKRNLKLSKAAVAIQRNIRRFLAKKKYLRLVAAINLVQTSVRFLQSVMEYEKLKREVQTITLQQLTRNTLSQQHLLFKERAVYKLQRVYRGFLGRKQVKQVKTHLQNTIIIQSKIRGTIVRGAYLQLLREFRDIESLQQQKTNLESIIQDLQCKLKTELQCRDELERKAKHWKEQLELAKQEVEDWKRKYAKLEQEKKQTKLSEKIQVIEKIQQEVALPVVEVEKKSQEEILPPLLVTKQELIREEKPTVLHAQPTTLQEDNVVHSPRATSPQVESPSASGLTSVIVSTREAETLRILEIEREKSANLQKQIEELKHLLEEEKQQPVQQITIEQIIHHAKGATQLERAEHIVAFFLLESQDRFYDNVPYPAVAIFQIIRYFVVAKDPDFECLLTFTLKGLFEAFKQSLNDLPFWLGNIALLVQQFSSEGFIVLMDETVDALQVQQELTQYLQTGVHSLVVPSVRFVVNFLAQMLGLFMKMYTTLLTYFFEKAEPLFKTLLFDEQHMQVHVLAKMIVSFVDNVKLARVPQSIVVHLIEQIAYYVDSNLFNQVLASKPLCSFAKGAHLKMCTVIIEQAISECLGREKKLVYMRQASTMLLINKELIVSREQKVAIIPDLSDVHIHRIMQLYTYDEYEKPLSRDMLEKLRQEASSHPANTVLLPTGIIYTFSNVKQLFFESAQVPRGFASLSPMFVQHVRTQTQHMEKWVKIISQNPQNLKNSKYYRPTMQTKSSPAVVVWGSRNGTES